MIRRPPGSSRPIEPPPPPSSSDRAPRGAAAAPGDHGLGRLVRWWLILLLAASVPGCRPSDDAGSSKGPPPVVLVSIDTLRADRLPAYGYRGVETPAIDRLRRDAILFEQAWSHYPLTLPSHASILTGRLPPDHGVRDNAGYRLPADGPYLPRDLRAAGYATAGAVSSWVLRGDVGLADGFDLYDDAIELRARTGLGGQQRPGEATLDAVTDWLAERGATPFFLFLHLYEPHTPYRPPEPFATRYAGSPYDGEVAAADRVVGRLLDELDRLGLYDRSLVILLSDHGEGLGDHGEDEHGVLLYREALQVPLLVKLPGGHRGGASVAAPAQLVDVYPTVAALAGLPVAEGLPGRSLLELGDGAPGDRRIYAETLYPRLHFGWSGLASVTDGRFHYLHGPRPELFDLATDPTERRDALRDHRRAYAALRAEAEAGFAPLAAPEPADAETRAGLASLGYLGGTVSVADGPLPDPRSRLPALAELERGMALAAARRPADAVRALAPLVEREPRMVDAWETLGRSWQALGEPTRALAAYREALRLSHAAPQIAVAAAGILLEVGRPAEAADHARLALAYEPAGARALLARAAIALGDLAAAEREAREALRLSADDPAGRLALAEVLRERGDPEAALGVLGRGAPDAGSDGAEGERRAAFETARGGLLARLGRAGEAEAAFRGAISADPRQPRAYTELALLLALTGRPAEAVGTLRALTTADDTPGAHAAVVRTLRVLGDPAAAERLRRQALARFPESVALEELADGRSAERAGRGPEPGPRAGTPPQSIPIS